MLLAKKGFLAIMTLLMGLCALLGCATGAQATVVREAHDPEAAAEAVALSAAARHYASNRAYFHYAMGALALHEDRLEDAARELKEALLYDRDALAIRTTLVEVHMRLGRPDRAWRHLLLVLEADPDYQRALTLKALLVEDDRRDTATSALGEREDGSENRGRPD